MATQIHLLSKACDKDRRMNAFLTLLMRAEDNVNRKEHPDHLYDSKIEKDDCVARPTAGVIHSVHIWCDTNSAELTGGESPKAER